MEGRKSEFAQVAVLLPELYATAGVMVIDFGYMFSGKNGGKRVAQFYFGSSLRWSGSRIRLLITSLLSLTWHILICWVLRPVGQAASLGLRCLFSRKPGWPLQWK